MLFMQREKLFKMISVFSVFTQTHKNKSTVNLDLYKKIVWVFLKTPKCGHLIMC